MTDIEKKHNDARVELFKSLLILLESGVLSDELIKEAEVEAGLTTGYYHILFPGGVAEIALALEAWLDNNMLIELAKLQKPAKIREQIALALETRIIAAAHKKAMLNICSFYLLPQNLILGTKVSCHTCDLVWRYAGDKSTDFNYYSKRALLLGAYVAAKTFYFADDSKQHKDTKEFIKNALDNIINIASLKKNIKLPKKEDIPIIRLFS